MDKRLFLLWAFIGFNILIAKTNAQDACFPTEFQKHWNAVHYDLHLDFDIKKHAASGFVKILFCKTEEGSDLLELNYALKPEKYIQSQVYIGKGKKNKKDKLTFTEKSVLVPLSKLKLQVGDTFWVSVYFKNKFHIAKNAPWETGLSVKKSQSGKAFWGFACQADGASFLFPCKDILSDKPELGVDLHYTVPKELKVIGNGKLIKDWYINKEYKAHYRVVNTINPYNISFYIGDFTRIKRTIQTEHGQLESVFSPLKEDVQKAEILLPRIDTAIQAFEYWCGPYPFYEDGCNFIQSPYLGMEHQSGIAYGNEYKPGYLGTSRSAEESGMLFDFIVVHELAHEWWGNSISVENMCDFWINEGWASYMESLYLEFVYGKDIADKYRNGKLRLIDTSKTGMGDCALCTRNIFGEYDKPAAMIHQIRLLINDDEVFRKMMLDLQKKYFHQTINTEAIKSFMQSYTSINLDKVYDQYLQNPNLPHLNCIQNGNKLEYYWSNCIPGFDMPVSVYLDDDVFWLYPKTEKQIITFSNEHTKISFNKEWAITISN